MRPGIGVVKSPLACLQKERKLLLRYTVKLAHVQFCLVRDILNSIDEIMLVSKQLGMVDPIMLELGNIQHVVRTVSIRIHNAVGDDTLLHNHFQCLSPGVGYDLRIDLSTAF